MVFFFFFFKIGLRWSYKSKETYGQTRGLINLEMKHIGELLITGVLLNAVKKSRVVNEDFESRARKFATRRFLQTFVLETKESQSCKQ